MGRAYGVGRGERNAIRWGSKIANCKMQSAKVRIEAAPQSSALTTDNRQLTTYLTSPQHPALST